jgi:hypothetical protein
VATGIEHAPLSLFPDRDALRSLDDLRRWWQATWFVGVPWTEAAEAYMRNTVVEQPDRSLASVTSDSVFAEILAAIVEAGGYRRDYGKVTAPTLFILPAGWLPAGLADLDQRRRAAEWHAQHYRPARIALVERLRQEVASSKIVELPGGNHNDFLFSQRTAVIEAMRDFLESDRSAGEVV